MPRERECPRAFRGKARTWERAGCASMAGAKVSRTSQSICERGKAARREARRGTLRQTSPSALGRMRRIREGSGVTG